MKTSLFLLFTIALILGSNAAIAKNMNFTAIESEPTLNKTSNIVSSNPASIEPITVKSRAELLKSNGKRIKLIGYYVSQSWNPGTASNTIDFKGRYNASQIILEDGEVISIFPSGHKQSLRSADEVNKYKGKLIEAIGVVKPKTKSADRPQAPEFFIDLKELKLVK